MESKRHPQPISDKEMFLYLNERLIYIENLLTQIGALLVYRFDASLEEAFKVPVDIESFRHFSERWVSENYK